MECKPDRPFVLDPVEYLLCLCTARGAVAGPSGMTSDHLFPIFENERDSEMFGQVGALLATGIIPSECWRFAFGVDDSCSEARWGRPGHHCGRHHPQAGGTNCRVADCHSAGCECVAHILQGVSCSRAVHQGFLFLSLIVRFVGSHVGCHAVEHGTPGLVEGVATEASSSREVATTIRCQSRVSHQSSHSPRFAAFTR